MDFSYPIYFFCCIVPDDILAGQVLGPRRARDEDREQLALTDDLPLIAATPSPAAVVVDWKAQPAVEAGVRIGAGVGWLPGAFCQALSVDLFGLSCLDAICNRQKKDFHKPLRLLAGIIFCCYSEASYFG